jgi:hypothetical protein
MVVFAILISVTPSDALKYIKKEIVICAQRQNALMKTDGKSFVAPQTVLQAVGVSPNEMMADI